jgi:adenosylmethionine-8-amino-7-oxononanoate aminotransferase
MIVAFDVATERPDFARRFFAAALERGALLRPLGNTVYFMPPYVLDKALTGRLAAAAAGALDLALSA